MTTRQQISESEYDLLYGTSDWFNSLRWQRPWIERMVERWCAVYGVPHTVIDFGAGDGWWCWSFLRAGAKRAVAIELSPLARQFIPHRVGFVSRNLCDPFDLGLRADLAICIEVAEHLPETAADTLVENVCMHATGLILFSAAPPGQNGTGHINCQTKSYWVNRFARFADAVDSSRIAREFASVTNELYQFLPANVQVFRMKR